jgi:hypothetical protein
MYIIKLEVSWPECSAKTLREALFMVFDHALEKTLGIKATQEDHKKAHIITPGMFVYYGDVKLGSIAIKKKIGSVEISYHPNIAICTLSN